MASGNSVGARVDLGRRHGQHPRHQEARPHLHGVLGGLAVQPVNVPPGTTSGSLGREPLTVPILGTFKRQGPYIASIGALQ